MRTVKNNILLEFLQEAGVNPRNVLSSKEDHLGMYRQFQEDGSSRIVMKFNGIAYLTDAQVKAATERWMKNPEIELDDSEHSSTYIVQAGLDNDTVTP